MKRGRVAAGVAVAVVVLAGAALLRDDDPVSSRQSRDGNVSTTRLSVSVVDAQGAPVGGAVVTARPALRTSLNGDVVLTATAVEGAYVVDVASGGSWRVEATAGAARGSVVVEASSAERPVRVTVGR